MVALCLDDLDGRPISIPGLRGSMSQMRNRGKGYGLRLMRNWKVWRAAKGSGRLSLYTASAVDLYSKAGWSQVECFEKAGETYWIMQKAL